MNLEYDQKFEEMKKYIPFLESMIKRLESTNKGVKNPRKAQLDKIRSLRDLLLDKKKRMKMENLVKCEQVLVNLYAKVEQRDSMVDTKEDCSVEVQKEKINLNIVRNKLKSVSKLQDDVPETLPEIARATNTEVVCTPGSKEPALFQRRPNKASPPTQSPSSHEDKSSNSKRHYTRVLLSPEHKNKEWLTSPDPNTEKPLFSRRSPRRSPRRYSPSYKKERKKSSKQRSKSSQQSEDLNITLKVPQESLGSLNTKDILSRIINCSDSDVDIDTLRGLRSQILGELKETGSKDDISDLILKSYKKKEKLDKKKEEVEEGELSDSESEAIENIYGSLVVVSEGEDSSNANKITNDKKHPRKIQICLVINSDKEKDGKANDQTLNTTLDISDFEVYTENKSANKTTSKTTGEKLVINEPPKHGTNKQENNISTEECKISQKIVEKSLVEKDTTTTELEEKKNSVQDKPKVSSSDILIPNFYQQFTEVKPNLEESLLTISSCKSSKEGGIDSNSGETTSKIVEASNSSEKIQMKKEVLEIDILQALKKEILGETTTVPIPAEITPPLHQPKVTKVANALEVVSKKRISIEKYKQKSVHSIKQPLFNPTKQQSLSKDDMAKKQSLKLTEKECERFNFPVNVSPVDSSEDEDKQSWDFEFLHKATKSSDLNINKDFPRDLELLRDNSAPKSPDHEDFADSGIRPPVIIPSDPVKNVVPNTKTDIDMRTLIPLVSLDSSSKCVTSSSISGEKAVKASLNDKRHNNENSRKSIPEVLLKTDVNQPTANHSPNPYLIDSDRLSRPSTSYSNIPPNISPNISSNIPSLMSLNVAPHMTPSQHPNAVSSITPIMTPILNSNMPLILNPNMAPNMTPTMTPSLVPNMNPSMTPSRVIPNMNPVMTPIWTPNARSYEMTPRINFDIDDYSNQKHVYAPIFPTFEPHDFSEKESIKLNQWENNETTKWEDRNYRSTSVQRDRYGGNKRLDSPQIRLECPSTPNPSFGRMECPSTPNPSFGRMECPSTPNPSFGRMECPSTPNPSFCRMEYPSTPNPSFGRKECPPTPSDCSMTPSYSFGRSENNVTSTNVFGRGDYPYDTSSFSHKYVKSHDPRLNRSSDYAKCHGRNDERKRTFFEDDYNMMENTRFRRGQLKSYDQDNRNGRERMPRRESSVGRSFPRDYETYESYNKEYYNNDYKCKRETYKGTEGVNNKRNFRGRSMGRMNQSEDNISTHGERAVPRTYNRAGSIEKPISVQSHTGRTFNIDTSFNRTFQETKSFDARRQRASSVGRSLRDDSREESNQTSTNRNKLEVNVSDRNALKFRRACSVGRDLKEYNADKNFKEIKEDLRSCKFNNYDFNLRNRDDKNISRMSCTNENMRSNECHSSRTMRVSNITFSNSIEHQTSRDPRRRQRDNDLHHTKFDDSTKHSPRINFRDPRMRREIDIVNTNKEKYKDKDRNARSSHYNTYGIVYSNDNIAKGTILASAAGVKNFKIPKIKRSVEEKVETNNQNEIHPKKEIPSKYPKKEDNLITDHNNKKDENKSTISETNITKNGRNMEGVNNDISVKICKLNSTEDLTSLNKTANKVKSNDENADSGYSILDSSERRITRSSKKDAAQSKIRKKSPIKKLKRIKKVYDSDSDSPENDSNNENVSKNVDGNISVLITEDTNSHKNNQDVKVNTNLQITGDVKSPKNKLDVDKGKIEIYSNTKLVNDTLGGESTNATNEVDTTVNLTDDKKALDTLKQKSVSVITNESCDEQNDSLDISFGVDDELFSDNIASGSVLDNINALIADLDHDIETPKINDFNDKFIKNIVGSISSNDSPIPLDANQTDFATDISLNEELSFVVDVKNSSEYTTTQLGFSKDKKNTDAIEMTNNESKSEHVNDLPQCEHPLHIQNEDIDLKKNVAKDLALSMKENSDMIVIQEKLAKNVIEFQNVIKIFNTDAIVSTTAFDEKCDEILKDSQSKTADSVPAVNSLVPDSTINANENNINIIAKDLQESIPDSTNELPSEINVTSTNNAIDVSSKEQFGANSTYLNQFPSIDSIGKLLSMLEDKNKIRELLMFFSKETSENKKIKKKLEKLSEIVSDDEENSREEDKDLNRQDHQVNSQENHDENNQRKDEDLAVTSLVADDKESALDNNKQDKVSYDGKSITRETIQSNNDLQNNIKTPVNSVSSKESDNVDIDKSLWKNKLLSDISRKLENDIENENIVENLVLKATDSNIDKEMNESVLVQNIEDVKNIAQQDHERISGMLENENQFMDKLNSEKIQVKPEKKIAKKSKITKKGRSKLIKNLLINKDKRVTRSEAGGSQLSVLTVPKKPSRELLKLQEDIRDMFISQDILNATGIRMCRLAKLVDDKHSKATPTTETEPEPIVVLENIKNKMSSEETSNSIEKNKKKKTSKNKTNAHSETAVGTESKGKPKYKPGPKSKTKRKDDPYSFETESVGESNNTVDSRDRNIDTDSDSVSAKSCGSSELLVELKKKTKRKRRNWQLGVIKKKGVKTKTTVRTSEFSIPAAEEVGVYETKDRNLQNIPDLDCFTDKAYCFLKNVKTYLCRLCGYRGNDIVPHYKKHHPHSEIPLSRLSPEIAKEAIEQCENINLQAISKIQTMKYVCRFCYQEFHKQSTALETFFWHVVSVHTGEYKHLCSECINVTRCPFHLDIPPPPKNLKGQLIGYICGRCNFTQVSLENLKTHVIIRHDDEQTEVYSINLSEIPRKVLQSLITKDSRVLRSTRSNQSITEHSDDHSDITESTDHIISLETEEDNLGQEINTPVSPKISPQDKIQSKLIFESDYMSDTSGYSKNDEIIKAFIKLERDGGTQDSRRSNSVDEVQEPALGQELELQQTIVDNVEDTNVQSELTPSSDVLDYPHFKIKLNVSGAKEYICCINGIDNHYKTTLLISFKKHVQLKHSENWDGYCFVCKVIVTGQGKHKFKDCLQHFLDKHIDDFPIFEEISEVVTENTSEVVTSPTIKDPSLSKLYINVRPLAELISSEKSETQEDNSPLPKIQNVVSLGVSDEPINSETQEIEKIYNYEEAQMDVMSKKHRVVMETMLCPEKLIQVYKCAGRFCSYTTDNAEEALLHASTHQRIGGEYSLKCTYCDFDCSGNAIDLVMHVFKNYSHCSYACSKCFYRAATSQLVYAHIKRVHSEFHVDKVPVLSSGTIVKDKMIDDFMSRDAAVLYYICNNRDSEDAGICQFKTYVLTKFREHMQTRHANDDEYSCYMCNSSMPSSKLLIQHLKSHGLQIYQCCRCLFGADSESELMAHASEKHPLKQPKAYLRIITSKSGSSEIRVLPLAVLSKSTVETTVVTPNTDKESPVKQAERSIHLEKLIGQTNVMIESMTTVTNVATIEPFDVIANENQIQLESEQVSSSTSQAEAESRLPAVLTLLKDTQDAPTMRCTVIKNEPIDTEKRTSEILPVVPVSVPSEPDVVCLDSDEDTACQNVIDLSGEDTPDLNNTKKQEHSSDIKIPRIRLYKCSKCFLVSKSEGMFKRHIISCFPDPKESIKCAYCFYSNTSKKIVTHYNSKHSESTVPYTCAICSGKLVSLAMAKKHMKLIHNETTTVVNLKTSSTGALQYIIDSGFKERQTPKRKLSSDNANKSTEPASKLKKYGPHDIDKLPITPILEDLVYCSLCEFSTKVRLNMVRHLQLHAEQQPVPRTAPVNPVPHLESNEKHFDKMVNLASSSIITSSKTSKDGTVIMSEYLSPEAAALYPKYVPDKHRYTCGAKDCSYISVNESMFKIHWETLHAGSNDYHCVHCPPHQHLDTSKPLTAVRIIAHLKMHDVKLYACSSCTFYHYSRKLIEKHFKEVHVGKIIIIREDGVVISPMLPSVPTASIQHTTPTMDLKPWQCGLCKFKSMIRPEVIEHCGKFHQSKMQFKCTYCGFRTSNIENISKHQSKQHPGKKEEVFYCYYREGSIPDESDGIAQWQKQSQKSESEIKTEIDIPSDSVPMLLTPAATKSPNFVNLDIVKKEIVEPEAHETEESIEDLCNEFGHFCDPNGLKYKCPLCKVIIEDTKEAMQSHLYEELQYRKWGCAVCSYKAFHKPGLQQHVQTEHRHNREAKEPIELQVDCRIETWVSNLLEHQTDIIEKNKENLAKQKAEILRTNPMSSVKVPEKTVSSPVSVAAKPSISMAELEKLFGPFGVPSNMNYTCPKCNISARTEAVMQEHLESELNKIRWCCSICSVTFQTYHEAQFHCRALHPGQSSRPVEATRDVSLRAAWVTAVLRIQKLSMNYMPVTEMSTAEISAPPTDNSPENSLLVVRYEEKVPTPEEQMKLNKKSDNDNDKLAMDNFEKKKSAEYECQYCNATYKFESFFQGHVLKHYGLKPFTCPYCPFSDHKKAMESHIKSQHPNRSVIYLNTPIPANPPVHDYLKNAPTKPIVIEVETKIICLGCEKAMTRVESLTHYHDNVRPQFGMKGTVVYRCWTCLTLHKTSNDFNQHHKLFHPNEKKNSSFYKLHDENRSVFCSICNLNFVNMAQFRSHQELKHDLKFSGSVEPAVLDAAMEIDEGIEIGEKRKAENTMILPVPKRVAKKSTTKLPNVKAVARKSTTKLPFHVGCDLEEYSYYGTKPSMDNLENVTTLMPFYNTYVAFTLKKFSEIIKIYPSVIVEDLNNKK